MPSRGGARDLDLGLGLVDRGHEVRLGRAAHGEVAFEFGKAGAEAEEFDPRHRPAFDKGFGEREFLPKRFDHRLELRAAREEFGEVALPLVPLGLEHGQLAVELVEA